MDMDMDSYAWLIYILTFLLTFSIFFIFVLIIVKCVQTCIETRIFCFRKTRTRTRTRQAQGMTVILLRVFSFVTIRKKTQKIRYAQNFLFHKMIKSGPLIIHTKLHQMKIQRMIGYGNILLLKKVIHILVNI